MIEISFRVMVLIEMRFQMDSERTSIANFVSLIVFKLKGIQSRLVEMKAGSASLNLQSSQIRNARGIISETNSLFRPKS